ncbi:tetratricopeptide repeat protein [Salinarimonas sp.]|uniref:tetratricopeptide repeat protein n=1 Tax=Salinarimonas sp. TaxID=2766526 RepID=UPI0032D8E13A
MIRLALRPSLPALVATLGLALASAAAAQEPATATETPATSAPALAAPAETAPVETERLEAAPFGAPPPLGEAADPDADLAYGAFQRGYYLTAFHRATQRLERDPEDAAAMTLLGELYAQGYGVAQDLARANDWYRLAAREGDPNALFALAMNAIEGVGRDRDVTEGRRLLDEAAEAGHPRAAYNLALLLLASEDEADLARAADLMRQAAEADLPAAQHGYGVLLAEGRGVEEDRIAATAWFSRAARNGDVSGMVEFAIALFNGEGIAPNPEEAARWFREAAFRGNAIAQNRLARLHAEGRGVPQDPIEAASWHLMAASQGLTDAWLDERLDALTPEERGQAMALAEGRLQGM